MLAPTGPARNVAAGWTPGTSSPVELREARILQGLAADALAGATSALLFTILTGQLLLLLGSRCSARPSAASAGPSAQPTHAGPGPPDDGHSRDAALGLWAGELPLATTWQQPIPDPALPPGIPIPRHIGSRASTRAGNQAACQPVSPRPRPAW